MLSPLIVTTTEIPTPRTDAVMQDKMRDGNDLPSLARELERETVRLANERDDYEESLNDIINLLPDESPCKHEQTGCSLYDDIQELILRAEGNSKTFNMISGLLHASGIPYSGTIVDGVRAAVARCGTLEKALMAYRVALTDGTENCSEAVCEALNELADKALGEPTLRNAGCAISRK